MEVLLESSCSDLRFLEAAGRSDSFVSLDCSSVKCFLRICVT